MPVTRAGAVRRPIEIENARRTFRFLELPAELRHIIYEHLMYCSRIHVCYEGVERKKEIPTGLMALFCVSKTLKAEVEVMWAKIVQQATFVIDVQTLAFQHDVYSTASPELGKRRPMPLSGVQRTIKERLAPSLCHLTLPSTVSFPIYCSWPGENEASVLSHLPNLSTVRMTTLVTLARIRNNGTFRAYLPPMDAMGNVMANRSGVNFNSPQECAEYLEKIWELGICDKL